MNRNMNEMMTATKGYIGRSLQNDFASCRKKYVLLHDADALFSLEDFFADVLLTILLQSHHKATKNVNIAATILGI